MPLYYFTTAHGEQRQDLDEPLELPDDKAAWHEATVACGEILKDIDGRLQPNKEWRMDVNNANNELIFSLRLIPEAYQRIKPE